MFTRYSKRIFLLILAITAVGVVPSKSSVVVVSQSFDLPIPSLDDPDSSLGRGRMDDAIINVAENCFIEDIDIAVLINHEAFYDLEIVLQNPAGTSITLNPATNNAFIIQDEGGSRSAGGQNRFLFDDEALIDIENAVQPFDQPFRPMEDSELSVFDGEYAYGQWRIQIRDAGFGKTGCLEQVELIITTPEPATIMLLALGTIAIYKRKSP